jgi:hypothetical protein
MAKTDNSSAIVRASYVQPFRLYNRTSLACSILIFLATVNLNLPATAGEQTFRNAGTYTWIVPPDADGHNVDFIVSGGGGGGGNGDDSNASQKPGWGGNGGYGCLPVTQSLRNFGLVAHKGDVYTIVVGKGGQGGQTNGSGGSPGDQTSISAGPVGANPSLFVVQGAPGSGHTHNPQGAQSGASTGGDGCFRGNQDASNGQSIMVNGALVSGGIGQARYAPNANYGGGGGGGGASQGVGGNGAIGGADQGSNGANHNGSRGADGLDGAGGGGGGGGGDVIGKGGPGGNGGDGVVSILW